MIFSKKNLIIGICLAIVSAILYAQTLDTAGALVSEGIHPMDYPRMLIVLLFILSVIIAVRPSPKAEKQKELPIFSVRILAMMGVFVLFAVLLNTMGFGVAAFLCSTLTAIIMQWKKYPILLLVNAFGCLCIWVLFTILLKIPLPKGTLW